MSKETRGEKRLGEVVGWAQWRPSRWEESSQRSVAERRSDIAKSTAQARSV